MANSLKGALQGMMPQTGELMIGEVIGIEPLEIKVVNDEKLVLSNTLRLPAHLTKRDVKCSISLGSVEAATDVNTHKHEYTYSGYTRNTESDTHSHKLESFSVTDATITLDNSLKVGDLVYLLTLNGRKLYFVIDRVV